MPALVQQRHGNHASNTANQAARPYAFNENIDETESAANGLGLDRRRLAGSGKLKQKINNLTISRQLSNNIQMHERNSSAEQVESPSK